MQGPGAVPLLAAKDAQIAALKQQLASKDAQMAALRQQLLAKDAELAARGCELGARGRELAAKDVEIGARDSRISELLGQAAGSCRDGPGVGCPQQGRRKLRWRCMGGAADAHRQEPGCAGVLSSCTWDVLASMGAVLPEILAAVPTPTLIRMWLLSRSVHAHLKASWPRKLDLSFLGSACHMNSDNHSMLLAFLSQARWKDLRCLTMPRSWVFPGKQFMLTKTLFLGLERHLPALRELDLLSYDGSSWTGVQSRVNAFADACRSLQSLKLRVYEHAAMSFARRMTALRSLHIGLPLWCEVVDALHPGPDGFFAPFRHLHALEEFHLLGEWGRNFPHCLFDTPAADLESFLSSCTHLCSLEIVPCVDLGDAMLLLLSSHARLQSLALHISNAMTQQGFVALRNAPSLQRLRLVRQVQRAGALPDWVQGSLTALQNSRPGVRVVLQRQEANDMK